MRISHAVEGSLLTSRIGKPIVIPNEVRNLLLAAIAAPLLHSLLPVNFRPELRNQIYQRPITRLP